MIHCLLMILQNMLLPRTCMIACLLAYYTTIQASFILHILCCVRIHKRGGFEVMMQKVKRLLCSSMIRSPRILPRFWDSGFGCFLPLFKVLKNTCRESRHESGIQYERLFANRSFLWNLVRFPIPEARFRKWERREEESWSLTCQSSKAAVGLKICSSVLLNQRHYTSQNNLCFCISKSPTAFVVQLGSDCCGVSEIKCSKAVLSLYNGETKHSNAFPSLSLNYSSVLQCMSSEETVYGNAYVSWTWTVHEFGFMWAEPANLQKLKRLLWSSMIYKGLRILPRFWDYGFV